MAKYILLLISLFHTVYCSSQTVEIINAGNKSSLRGMSLYGSSVWVSGSNGTVGHSADKGKTWRWMTVPGFEISEFRDIEVLNSNTIVIMAVTLPAAILKSIDGGKTWQTVYHATGKEIFLDAIAFKNKKKGIVVGDPINNNVFIAKTSNAGSSWQQSTELNLPLSKPDEAFFAASGSNIVLKNKNFYLVSGGKASRIFMNNKVMQLPIMQGSETSGANAVAVYKKKIVVAGGDFNKPDSNDSVVAISNNNGKSWHLPSAMPSGYRSCICFVNKKILVACGINGVDISKDGGNNWQNISKEGFNTCTYSKRQRTIYLAGNKGKVGKIVF